MPKKKNYYKLNTKSFFSTHNLLASNIPKKATVLDVGCNDGYLGLIRQDCLFYGLDLSSDSVKKAKAHYKDALVYNLNTLSSLPWNKKFDAIIFGDVLEHTLDPEIVLKFFVSRYLKPTGLVIMSLPNVANFSVRLNLLLGNFDYTNDGILDRTHLHLYTYKTAQELIYSGGLFPVKILYAADFLGYLIYLFPFLRNLLAMNIVLVCKKAKNA